MKKQFIIHPFLFALFPALFLYSHNIAQILGSEIYLPIAVVLISTSVIWLLLSILIKHSDKAAAITSVFMIYFFSYGYLYDLINKDSYLVGKNEVAGHGLLLLILTIISVLIIFLIIKRPGDFHNITRILTIVVIFMVTVQIGKIFISVINSWRADTAMEKQLAYDIDMPRNLKKPAKMPNIYYIILDGYPRADTLVRIYQYDNGDILQYLTKNKFYIANKSVSNYCQTTLSLASSLNYDYLDKLTIINKESNERVFMFNLLQGSRVIYLLRKLGYKIIHFSSGYKLVSINNADIHIASRFGLPEFQDELLNTTPIPFLFKYIPFLHFSEVDLFRKRILFIFSYLDDVLKIKPPVFIFAHILCPHPPFVFDRNGLNVNKDNQYSFSDGPQLMEEKQMTRDEYVKAYREQVMFVNAKIKETLKDILSVDEPSVIILQADHGPASRLNWNNVDETDLKERFGILNAYYFPDHAYEQLYQTISPVNTFRVLFNHYFGTDYELLPDKSYFSSWDYPYKFIDVSGKTN